MPERKNITLYIEGRDKEIIQTASKEVGLNSSSFCRNVALMRAKEILSQKRENGNCE